MGLKKAPPWHLTAATFRVCVTVALGEYVSVPLHFHTNPVEVDPHPHPSTPPTPHNQTLPPNPEPQTLNPKP